MFSTNGAGTTGSPHARKRNVDLTPFIRINSRRIIDLQVKCKTIKLLGDYIGENLGDLEYDRDMVP